MEELFFNSDSGNKFEGSTRAEIDVEAMGSGETDHESEGEVEEDTIDEENVLSDYEHLWLTDFEAISGPKEVPDGISEGELFRLFITDSVIMLFVKETNWYADHVKEKSGKNARRHSYISI